MDQQEIIELRPTGWEHDPPEELFRLSTVDYCVVQSYTNYALFFKLSDEIKPNVIHILQRGLEITLSQCQQLCGIVDEHPEGGLCFRKKKDSTVQFHVQWLDRPEHEGKYPSFDELEKHHFISEALGNMETWCVPPMTYGEKPEAQPAHRPKVAAFKATFIKGGLVFVMHHLHYANDVMGWAGELHQLAENCAAIWKSEDSPAFPSWDPACLDLSRLTKPELSEDQQIDGPPPSMPHPDHKPCQWFLFHLPKSKMMDLKNTMAPKDNSYWVSSYDTFMA